MTRAMLPSVAVLLLSCGTSPVETKVDADVRGVIVGVLPDARALVALDPGHEPLPDTIFVNPGSVINVRTANGSVLSGGRGDIVVGARISAWLTGVELRSLPPQYPAGIVEIQHSVRR